MALLIKRYLRGLLAPGPDARAPFLNARPERIVLNARPDVRPCGKPPVRIYLGTEDAQYRAERIFVWSIEQVRDPSRVYEIYLMKNLAGFKSRYWLTGFTNYRFAIPDFAGYKGRAIYNDVDQIYLSDPAELFDLNMQSHAYLSITARDTSVMVMDCERMASVWSLEAAKSAHKNRLLDKAAGTPGLWGRLEPEWNARNDEYEKGRSKVLHYTILHMQPWRPFPEDFVYLKTPQASVWHELAQSADAANYQNFSAGRPSENYEKVLRAARKYLYAAGPKFKLRHMEEDLRQILAGLKVQNLMVYGLSSIIEKKPDTELNSRLSCNFVNPAVPPQHDYYAQSHEAVVCDDFLEYLPDEDIPWVLNAVFAAARRVVYSRITQPRLNHNRQRSVLIPYRIRSVRWWYEQFEAAAAQFPDVHWKLEIRDRQSLGRTRRNYFEGGAFLDQTPVVWVLTHSKPGQNSQATGLAEALGWPYLNRQIECSAAQFIGRRIVERLSLNSIKLDAGLTQTMTPGHRPDVIIAAGWLPTRIARLFKRRSQHHVRLVLEGRKASAVRHLDEVVVSSAHFNLPPHPRRIDALLPPHGVTSERLKESADEWCAEYQNLARPHIALLVGGNSRQFELNEQSARAMCEKVRSMAAAAGGSVLAITSRRTGEGVSQVIKETLEGAGSVHVWSRNEQSNPYMGYLANADAFVVTGESESMLAEAISTGKPVYIYPVSERPPTMWMRFTAWVSDRANTRPLNNRGTVRPQQGLEYICARLVDRGLVLPPRDLEGLHQGLVNAGLARMFGEPLKLQARPPENTTGATADKVRELLGVSSKNAKRVKLRLAVNNSHAGT